MVPEFEMVAATSSLRIPSELVPEFDTVIVPSLMMLPSLEIPVLSEFDTTSVVPTGIVRVSPDNTVKRLPVLIVHVSVSQSAATLSQRVWPRVPLVAYAFWKRNDPEKTIKDTIIDSDKTPKRRFDFKLFDFFYI